MFGRWKFLMAGAMGARPCSHWVFWERTGMRRRLTVTGSADDAPVTSTPPLEKYVDPLPTPLTAVPDPSVYPGADYYEITMRQGSWRFHRDLKPATVWG